VFHIIGHLIGLGGSPIVFHIIGHLIGLGGSSKVFHIIGYLIGLGGSSKVFISWRIVLLVEETQLPGENHRPAASP
jgi:hypothetical protein